ncbi:hypothetical protein HPGCJGGD_2017 [Methylobacterium haplocladii]|nr:hypothetical protein HPGCJGGD_2017 [Methylobacterium haplocladii]
MRLLPDLLAPQSRTVRSGRDAFGVTGETRLGLSEASAALGIDLPRVAGEIRRRVDAFLTSQSGPTAGARDIVLLSVLALLDMMTLTDDVRLVLAGRDAPWVAAYGASHELEVRLLPGSESQAPLAADHTLLALGLPLRELSGYVDNAHAVKGIVLAPVLDDDATRSITSRLPVPSNEIATGVDLGMGGTVAWLWPRL